MDKRKFTFYYGIALMGVDIAVFFRIPEVVSQVETIEFFKNKIGVITFCFYFLGFLLVLAGGTRVVKNYKKNEND